MSSMSMRGLSTFISDIRNCTTKDLEVKRVDKELANIRTNFADKRIDGYSLKKYTWKLLYIHMLGYEVNIGHMEVLKLVGSNKYSEKLCGYLSMQILWNEDTELLKLLVQQVKKDLNPLVDNGTPLNEYIQCLALNFLANMGGRDFAEALATDVQKLLTNGNSRSFVRKKAALCLLRMIRLDYYCIHIDQSFSSYLLALLDDPNLGVVTSVISLILGLVATNSSGFDKYTVQKCIVLLAKLSFSKEKKSIYRYYLTVNPWLQVKILRLLTYFPLPTDPNLLTRLHHVLNDILTKTTITKNINKNNADYSILFEALNVIIHYASTQQQTSQQLALTSGSDDDRSPTSPPSAAAGSSQLNDLVNTSLSLLSKFISIKESNFRYLGIETMTRFLVLDNARKILKKHIAIISTNLHDIDISIQKRAIDLLYTLCDASNSREIIETFLVLLDSCPIELKSELTIKIAILAEKFTTEQTTQQSNMTDAEASKDYKKYITIILKLIDSAGMYVTEDIWFRTVQIVTNSDEAVQAYAVRQSYRLLTHNTSIHETGLKVCAYIIGEFGDQISAIDGSTALVPHANANALVVQNGDASHTPKSATEAADDVPLNITGRDLYNVLDKHFLSASNPTKALILTAYMKLTNTYPELRSSVSQVFKQYSSVIDIELQQRSVEYGTILNEGDADAAANSTALALTTGGAAASSSGNRLLESVFDVMPNWDITNRENLLMKKISKTSRMPHAAPQTTADEVKSDEEDDDEVEYSDEDEAEQPVNPLDHHTNSSGKHTKSATLDLLGLSMNDPNSTELVASSVNNTQISPFAPQNPAELPALIGQDSGVIYDNTTILQIGYKIANTAADAKHTCKLALYYGNRSDFAISNFMLTMNEKQANHVIRHQIKPSEILDMIPAKKQIPHYLLIESLRPFPSYLHISLSFTWNDTQHTLPLSIPITMSSFITPTPMSFSVFGNVWQKYLNELVKIAHIRSAAQSGQSTAARVRSHLTNRLHLANIDSPHDNLVIGTGTFHTVTVTMPCLVKVETKDTAVRITVHSGHSTVSDALLHRVVTAIEATV